MRRAHGVLALLLSATTIILTAPPSQAAPWPTRTIYVQTGHLDGRWPLAVSLGQINRQNVVHLIPHQCVTGVPCITVISRAQDAGQYAGVTQMTTQSGAMVTARIIMFDDQHTQRLPAGWRRGIMSHELLHAVGLEHVQYPGSVMNPTCCAHSTVNVGGYDRNNLIRLYFPDRPIP